MDEQLIMALIDDLKEKLTAGGVNFTFNMQTGMQYNSPQDQERAEEIMDKILLRIAKH